MAKVYWTAKLGDFSFFQEVIAWNFESPQGEQEDLDSFQVRGWIISSSDLVVSVYADGECLGSCKAAIPRPDVWNKKRGLLESLGRDSACGFEINVRSKKNIFSIVFELAGRVYRVLTIQKLQEEKVIHGKEGYLFLGHDTNKSPEQYQGHVVVDQRSLAGWRAHFSLVRQLSRELNFNYVFSIAPAKEEVLKEFYPYRRAEVTTVDVFRETFEQEPICFHVDKLLGTRYLSFNRTDTHWTDFGALLAARQLLERLGLSDVVQCLNIMFEAAQTYGDLGSKFAPPRADYFLRIASASVRSVRIFDNCISNKGCIRIYESISAPVNQTLVMFGDSFGDSLAVLMANVFRRVVFNYKPASIDRDILAIEKPRYVIFEINQRFLIGQPDGINSSFDIIQGKLSRMSVEETRRFLEIYHEKAYDQVSPYYDIMVRLIVMTQ